MISSSSIDRPQLHGCYDGVSEALMTLPTLLRQADTRRGGYCVPFELPSDAIGSLSHRVHRRQRRHVYSGFESEESRQFFVCVFTWFKVRGADMITESSPSSQRSTTLTT
eukprot:scaffold4607_cov76-Skeletonema_dohrnii-CCMP3373.AAC.1